MSKKWKKSQVQALMFKKEKWRKGEAKKWLREHGFEFKKIHETENFYRFRQFDPSEFKSMRTKAFSDKEGIYSVIGEPKKKGNPNSSDNLKKKSNPVLEEDSELLDRVPSLKEKQTVGENDQEQSLLVPAILGVGALGLFFYYRKKNDLKGMKIAQIP